MKCTVFRNKLYDYMEGNVENDVKKAMEEHMKKCEACRNIYNEEKQADEIIKDTLSGDEIRFNSSRDSIMKNIDKNKYTGSIPNKIGLNVKKYRMRYLSSAAILVLVVATSTFLFNYAKDDRATGNSSLKDSVSIGQLNDSSQTGSDKNGTSSNTTGSNETVESRAKADDTNNQNTSKEISDADLKIGKYTLKFNKIASEKDPAEGWAMPAKTSPDGKIKAQIDGRGPEGAEEGPADIFIAKGSGEKWRFQVVNEVTGGVAQITPMYLEWLDNENLLITAGGAFGTVSYGGSVYKMNINTGAVSMFYKVDIDKEQVTIIKKSGNTLNLTVKVFTDENKNQTREEERTIKIPQ